MTAKHLSLWALPLMLYQTAKNWLWLVLVGGFGVIKGGVAWWQLVVFAAALVLGLAAVGLRYWRFTYVLEPKQLTINSGLFVKKIRHIPYAKIQTLERQQWFFMQPFGLEAVSIETASKDGKQGEGTLLAVPLSVADTIEARRHLEPAPQAVPDEAVAPMLEAPDASYQINSHDLHLYALTSLGFLPLLAVLGTIYNRVDDVLPKAWENDAAEALAQLAAVAIIGLTVFILVVAILISYLSLIARYWHFTLTKRASTLTATRGFFKRNTVSVRLKRIQAARLRQSLLRQWLHLTTVQAITASNAADNEADNDLVLMPVVQTPQAAATMHRFIDWLPAELPSFLLIPAANRWLYSRNLIVGNLVLVMPACLAVAVFKRQWLPQALVIAALWLIVAALQGRYAATHSGVAMIDGERLAISAGTGWSYTQYLLRRQNIQALTLANTIWMAPKHRVHLRLHIRRGDNDLTIAVRYLDAATAQQVQDWYRPADAGKKIWFSEK